MRLLIIEDEFDLANALERGLRRQGYAVDVATNGRQGWKLAETHDYDLLILDLNLPDMDGLEICRRLRERQSDLLILMLTARSRPDQCVTGLDCGADDYVVKPFHFGELIARIRALLRRDTQVRDPVLQYKDLKLDPATRTVWQDRRRIELTTKEFGILHYLMRYQGEAVSREELLEYVWDREANPLSNTVRVHVASLRRKLEDSPDEPRYIETIVGTGYRLGAPIEREGAR